MKFNQLLSGFESKNYLVEVLCTTSAHSFAPIFSNANMVTSITLF